MRENFLMLQFVAIALQRQLAAMTAPTVKVRTGDSEEPTEVMTSTPAVANNVSASATVSTLECYSVDSRFCS